jgi:hypothetical protein
MKLVQLLQQGKNQLFYMVKEEKQKNIKCQLKLQLKYVEQTFRLVRFI